MGGFAVGFLVVVSGNLSLSFFTYNTQINNQYPLRQHTNYHYYTITYLY